MSSPLPPSDLRLFFTSSSTASFESTEDHTPLFFDSRRLSVENLARTSARIKQSPRVFLAIDAYDLELQELARSRSVPFSAGSQWENDPASPAEIFGFFAEILSFSSIFFEKLRAFFTRFFDADIDESDRSEDLMVLDELRSLGDHHKGMGNALGKIYSKMGQKADAIRLLSAEQADMSSFLNFCSVLNQSETIALIPKTLGLKSAKKSPIFAFSLDSPYEISRGSLFSLEASAETVRASLDFLALFPLDEDNPCLGVQLRVPGQRKLVSILKKISHDFFEISFGFSVQNFIFLGMWEFVFAFRVAEGFRLKLGKVEANERIKVEKNAQVLIDFDPEVSGGGKTLAGSEYRGGEKLNDENLLLMRDFERGSNHSYCQRPMRKVEVAEGTDRDQRGDQTPWDTIKVEAFLSNSTKFTIKVDIVKN